MTCVEAGCGRRPRSGRYCHLHRRCEEPNCSTRLNRKRDGHATECPEHRELCKIRINGRRCSNKYSTRLVTQDAGTIKLCRDHQGQHHMCSEPECLNLTQHTRQLRTEWFNTGDTKHQPPRPCSWDEWEKHYSEMKRGSDSRIISWMIWTGKVKPPHGNLYCNWHLQNIPFRKPDDCPICMENMKAVPMPLECGHWVHRKCLLGWSDICPICRAPVKLTSEERKVVDERRAEDRKKREFAEHSQLVRRQLERVMRSRLRRRETEWKAKASEFEQKAAARENELRKQLEALQADRDALRVRLEQSTSAEDALRQELQLERNTVGLPTWLNQS
jgi:hypothetical protein